MKKHNYIFVLCFISIILSFQITSAQEVGKIFTVQEADSLFGKVVSSKSFSKIDFENFFNKTNKVLMFKLSDDKLRVLNDSRTAVFPKDLQAGSSEVYSLFSVSKLNELIELGKSNTIIFENRLNEFTISNGNFILEKAWPCPPFCTDE